MTQFDEHDLPDELHEVAERLRDARPTFTELELDQLKLRAMAKSSEGKSTVVGRTRGNPMRSRVLTLALTALLIGGTTAGGIAASGGGGGGNSAQSQYKPGKGCGDNNHTHTGPPGQNDNDADNSQGSNSPAADGDKDDCG
jgi:hypothetical protein